MITLMLFLSMLQAVSDPIKSDTTYVPTMGSRFYLTSEAPFQEFALLAISDTSSTIKAIQFLKASSATGNMKYQMMLNLVLRQIALRNYSEEECLVLISPRTRAGMLGQPFRVGSDPTLIYTFADEKTDTEDYASVRVLVRRKENDRVPIVVRCSSGDITPKEFVGAP